MGRLALLETRVARRALCTLSVLTALFASDARAQAVPRHLSSMAATLYKELEREIESGALSGEHRTVAEESAKTLRGLGVHRWSAKPVTLPGSAREIDEQIDALEKTHVTETDDGRKVTMRWEPDEERFALKVLDFGATGGERFASGLSGSVEFRADADGRSLGVRPVHPAFSVLTDDDIETLGGNILGTWHGANGDVYEISAGSEQTASVRPPREFYDRKIEELQEKVKDIKATLEYRWQNPKTGEVVRQTKFRRLQEPFEYHGKAYASETGEEEIANLESAITKTKSERDGYKPPPVDRYDPAGFARVSGSVDSQAITVTVTRADGYSYTYDSAAFDGSRISAKRTYRDLRDLTNEDLPDVIKSKLISGGWNPPGWLELDASIDTETGGLALDGSRWSLHVTYSSFFGGAPDVDRIHSPESDAVGLRRDDTGFQTADGAAAGLVP